MKRYIRRYIRTNTNLSQGSYLLARDGDILETMVHAPSTTFLDRGIYHLVPTDAEFLLRIGKITEDDAYVVLTYCFSEYLLNEQNADPGTTASIIDVTNFNSYAEMRYAPTVRGMLMKHTNDFKAGVDDKTQAHFNRLNNKWYKYLKNNFVKVSVFNNVVEFRISSEDDFDWNSVIIDYGILANDISENSSTKYTIARESSKGYKIYFLNATINDILESDNVILSSTCFNRKVVASNLVYEKR